MSVNLGILIRNRREKIGMTQIELSEKLGLTSSQFVSLFERGKSKVPLSSLKLICEAIGLNKKKAKGVLVYDYMCKLNRELGD